MSWPRLVLLLVLTSALATAASAGDEPDPMPPDHPMMMDDAQRAAMMEKMRARQQKLDELMAAMEAAEGDAKVDAIARVVSELVAQRKAMAGHMQSMCGGPMGAACGCAMGAMGDCPMRAMHECPMAPAGEGAGKTP